jgi:predicted small metal-binding protein
MTSVTCNYCTECGWSASAEEYSTEELSELAIEHFLETGHTIESEFTTELATESVG